ncbi:pleckstrin homology domain-containing family A member 3 [Hyalella azteca]|uniref:Pleckstrin homology domain-containing family A member 3 n=1 Tax=Hyalella azteca TaxID=294128 RepID=A0A8B7PLK9_HYAAZ|nr:pleckstrin homology domain-containing family A member 3 [Hyalella azteca]
MQETSRGSSRPTMEGILYKWTNYWNGWQPRWFVLTDGELTYYKNEEDVNSGCKGSVKLCACQILVHPTDSLRVDIVIPYEQRFYLKAPSQMQRHAWLVALGNAKAGLPPAIQQCPVPAPEPDALKAKRSELRLTCDLLMKQVYDLKVAATAEGGPDLKELDEAGGLLSATCDTFCRALDECMKLSLTPTLPADHEGPPPTPPLILVKGKRLSTSSLRRTSAQRNGSTE